MTHKYFNLENVAHEKKCLRAGFVQDGRIYLDAPDKKAVAEWRFEDAGDGYCFIVDNQHGMCLEAGDNFDGNLYHQPFPTNKDNAKWRVEEGAEFGTFRFIDRKHGKAIVSGQNFDGRGYHNKAGDTKNGEWKLIKTRDGEQGPNFYVVKEKMLKVEWGDPTNPTAGPDVIIERTARNNSRVASTFAVEKKESKTETETWNFDVRITASIAQSITATGGIPGLGEVSATTEAKLETSLGYSTGGSKTRTHELGFSTSVLLNPGESVKVQMTRKSSYQTIPFTAIIERTLGDGSRKVVRVPGTWEGVQYDQGHLEFLPVEADKTNI